MGRADRQSNQKEFHAAVDCSNSAPKDSRLSNSAYCRLQFDSLDPPKERVRFLGGPGVTLP